MGFGGPHPTLFLGRTDARRTEKSRPFPNCAKALFQSETKSEAIDVKMIFSILMQIKFIILHCTHYLSSHWLRAYS